MKRESSDNTSFCALWGSNKWSTLIFLTDKVITDVWNKFYTWSHFLNLYILFYYILCPKCDIGVWTSGTDPLDYSFSIIAIFLSGQSQKLTFHHLEHLASSSGELRRLSNVHLFGFFWQTERPIYFQLTLYWTLSSGHAQPSFLSSTSIRKGLQKTLFRGKTSNHPRKLHFFDPNFTFHVPRSQRFGKVFPNKTGSFFGTFPKGHALK